MPRRWAPIPMHHRRSGTRADDLRAVYGWFTIGVRCEVLCGTSLDRGRWGACGECFLLFPIMEPTLIRPTVAPRPFSISSRSIWRRISSRTKWQWYRPGQGRRPTEKAKSVLAKIRGGCQDTRRAETPTFSGLAVASLYSDPQLMSKSESAVIAAEAAPEYGFKDFNCKQPSRTEGLSAIVVHEELILRLGDPPFHDGALWVRFRRHIIIPHHRSRGASIVVSGLIPVHLSSSDWIEA
jgi:hypothetical protein